MINPTKKAEHVVSDGLAGERRAFTIKATGKAFRTLIDGLYENKIGAVVREIMSNGYDSHAAADIGDAPIFVTAPTTLDPTFRVRDFGVSMSHEDVMDLYSTIFESTKENTNDQVGMFGLGSKSPFAYTDTFSVTAFGDGEKRVYVAHISDDDVPQITHIVTEPQDAEPQGIEVAVPVKPMDVNRFHLEITRMVFASDVTPEVDGMGKDVPEPVLVGEGWRVVPDTHNMGGVAIRQGCVIYPSHSFDIRSIKYGYTTIVDVPIGSVEVTASRESLSLTPETTQYVQARVQETNEAIKDWANNLEFKNRLDAFQRNHDYDFLSFGVGRHQINLDPDKPADRIKVPAQAVEVMASKRKRTRKSAFNMEPSRIVAIVERPGEKVPRKNLRLGEFYSTHRYNRQILVISTRELPRVVRLLGLGPDQVIPMCKLPDVQVTRNPSGGGGSTTKGVNAAPDTLAKGKFWMEKVGAKSLQVNIAGVHIKTTDDLFLKATRGGYYDTSPTGIGPLLTELGFMVDQVEFFTEKQAKDKGLTGRRTLMAELVKRATAYASKSNLQARFEAYANHKKYIELTKYGLVSDEVTRVLGVSRFDKQEIFTVACRMAELSIESLIPVKFELSEVDQMIIRLLRLSLDPSKITLTKAQISAKIEEAVSPLKSLAKQDDPFVHLIETYIANNNKEDASE